MSLKHSGVVWRSSWGLRSCGSTTRRTSSSPVRLLQPAQTVHLKLIKGMSLQLAGVLWRSSWGLGSYGSTTRRTSSSPIHLLRLAQTIHLKPIKG
ncbi:hypothetical protein Taro_039714, partial [Colocasia esculenta]|nr:hypothetical protein [Colocasia esculenta]